jgi:hypothetical protein
MAAFNPLVMMYGAENVAKVSTTWLHSICMFFTQLIGAGSLRDCVGKLAPDLNITFCLKLLPKLWLILCNRSRFPKKPY